MYIYISFESNIQEVMYINGVDRVTWKYSTLSNQRYQNFLITKNSSGQLDMDKITILNPKKAM
jgi:hypothetical protein